MQAPLLPRALRQAAGASALLALLLVPAGAAAQAVQKPGAWPEITRDARPWTRWWWMGSAVDSANLRAELRTLSDAGFGGVEVTSIYGVRGQEHAFVPYLSERWIDLLLHAAREARALGMGLDMPPGSGWRTGGPLVSEEDANASLRVRVDTVRGGALWEAELADRRVDAVVAFATDGRYLDLGGTRGADGVLRWRAPAGEWRVYLAETRFSGDRVKRPAPGGEGYAFDPFSRRAVDNFLVRYGQRLDRVPRGTIRALFHDSFEYSGDGTAGLFAEFERRRGYDLKRHLPALLGQDDPERVGRVKSDYRETIHELLLESFLQPLAEWSHARGSLSRNQAHGSPGNLLDLYAASDIPETEIFGPLDGTDSDPLINKFASSAANVAGRRLASAEAMTWLEEHFSASLDQVKQAADELFLSGVNHLIYHGTTYSPASAPWPGWLFYASAEFNPRNAFWRDLPALNGYVARVQSVLQSGRPDNDVLVYWPIYDSWHERRGMRLDFRVHNPTWLHDMPIGAVARTLWDGGFPFDYVSDRQLRERVTATGGALRAGAAEYRVVLVPATRHMPPVTLDRLLQLAREGATVAFQGDLPADVPGMNRVEEGRRELDLARRALTSGARPRPDGVREARVGAGRVLVGADTEVLLRAAGVRPERLGGHAGVRAIRRRLGDGRYYFVAHTGSEAVDGWVPLALPAAAVVLMDPVSGRTGTGRVRRSADGGAEVYLQLDPGASIVLRTLDHAPAVPAWSYRRATGRPVVLRGTWSVAFVEGGPDLPAPLRTDSLVSWTELGGEAAQRFAGTARYTLRFDAPARATGDGFLLDLGRVAESARVRLNGRELGTLFARPFRVETGALRPRGNVLEVEVTNLSANRIRDLDRRGVPWKIFHDINFVGIDYKPFDASGWPLRPSGLLGPVTLTPVATGPDVVGAVGTAP